MDVFETFSVYVEAHSLLERGERVVVGVSGGADSLCLLDCLTRWGATPIVAHLDHQLRPESEQECDNVRDVARGYGHKFVSKRVDPGTFNVGSLEERARIARYAFLVELSNKFKIAKIAVGHTFDDQVETILMHLMRGAGPSGLRGMLPLTSVGDWVGLKDGEGRYLIRPLLPIRHTQTLAYCAEAGLKPHFDPTNTDQNFTRNRIRHHLLPILEDFNPGIRSVIYRTGEIMRSEVEFIRAEIDRRWDDVATLLPGGALILNARSFEQQPLAIQRGIARRAILSLRPGLRDAGFDHYEQVVSFCLDPERADALPLIDDLLLYDLGQDVILAPTGPLPPLPGFPQILTDMEEFRVPEEGELELANGWTITSSAPAEVDVSSIREIENPLWEAHIDASRLPSSLAVRARKPGDRMQPLGMSGTVKVSDLMINRKIPRLTRPMWPLVVADEAVVWIPGVHSAHPFRITEHTEKALHLKVSMPPSASQKWPAG